MKGSLFTSAGPRVTRISSACRLYYIPPTDALDSEIVNNRTDHKENPRERIAISFTLPYQPCLSQSVIPATPSNWAQASVSFTEVSERNLPYHLKYSVESDVLRKDSAVELGDDFQGGGSDEHLRSTTEAAVNDEFISHQSGIDQRPSVLQNALRL
jgi:hypothetical protein